MSLRVWLPLRGTLDNLGLDNITVTNNGATVDNNGKIGSCYAFDGNDYLQATSPNLNIKSVTFWVYTTKANAVVFADYKSKFAFGFNSVGDILTASGTTYPDHYDSVFSSDSFVASAWNHVAIVRNPNDNLCDLWLNGVNIPRTSNVNYFRHQTDTLELGRRSTGTNFTGRLNDFRMYDHALSEKEIKDISKALVLHYPLNERVGTLTNAYSYPTFDTSSASGGWNHWGGSGHAGSYAQNTDKQFIYNKANTYSHKVANGAGATYHYLMYQSPAFDGGYRSIQFIMKESTGVPITEDICFPAWNARDGGAPSKIWTSIHNLGDGFYLCKCEGIHQDGSNDLIGIGVQAGYTVYISEAYLEDNKEFCSEIFGNDGVIHDCSGYHNDGSVNAITITSDSPRYGASSAFSSSTTSYIKVTDNSWMAQAAPEFTINFWANPATWAGQTKYFSCTESGGFNTESGNSGYIRFPNHVYTNAALTSTAYKYSSNELKISDITAGWHMLTFIYTLTGNKVYLDGALHSSYAFTSYGEHFNTNARLFLGCEANTASPSTPYYTGSMSDFRFYYTELSADEVKELYEVGASIDNFQNNHTYWYEEDTNDGNLISQISVISSNATKLSNDSVRFDFSAQKDTYFFFQTKVALESSKTYYLSFDVEGMADGDSIKFGVPQNRTYGDFVLHNGHNIGSITNCDLATNTNLAFDDYVKTSSSIVTLTNIRLFETTNTPEFKKSGVVCSNSFSDGETHTSSIYKNGDITAKDLIEI